MIYQGLSDTLLGHPGRGGSPAACPELTTAPNPEKANAHLLRLKGGVCFFCFGGGEKSLNS